MCLLASSCGTVSQAPKWNGKLWAGDSKSDAVVRKQSNEQVQCSKPDFDKYVCMTYDDLQGLYNTYALGCREWKPGFQMSEGNTVWQSSSTEKSKSSE